MQPVHKGETSSPNKFDREHFKQVDHENAEEALEIRRPGELRGAGLVPLIAALRGQDGDPGSAEIFFQTYLSPAPSACQKEGTTRQHTGKQGVVCAWLVGSLFGSRLGGCLVGVVGSGGPGCRVFARVGHR